MVDPFYPAEDLVFVNAYTRFRLGQWEDVCAHYRSYPGQLTLF